MCVRYNARRRHGGSPGVPAEQRAHPPRGTGPRPRHRQAAGIGCPGSHPAPLAVQDVVADLHAVHVATDRPAVPSSHAGGKTENSSSPC